MFRNYDGDGDSRSARVVGVFGRSTIASTANYRRRQYDFVGSFSNRSMERYCKQNEGTFFFVRPIYSKLNWFADQIDFGIFTKERGLLLNRFDNKLVS